MTDLKVVTIQTDIFWENPHKNLSFYEGEYLNKLEKSKVDLIVLPELFPTGFKMNTIDFGEEMDGNTINWMQKWANRLSCHLIGSVIIKENNNYFNRLLVVSKNGIESFYDKKHLFRIQNCCRRTRFKKGNESYKKTK